MYKGVIFGRECEMLGGPYTLLIYKDEFGVDLSTAIIDAYSKEIPDIEDYLKIAWAMCKTFDRHIPQYEYWLDDFDTDKFDLGEGQDSIVVIDSAINAEVFRQKPTLKTKFRRWVIKHLFR